MKVNAFFFPPLRIISFFITWWNRICSPTSAFSSPVFLNFNSSWHLDFFFCQMSQSEWKGLTWSFHLGWEKRCLNRFHEGPHTASWPSPENTSLYWSKNVPNDPPLHTHCTRSVLILENFSLKKDMEKYFLFIVFSLNIKSPSTKNLRRLYKHK